jgi:hypothetical protein
MATAHTFSVNLATTLKSAHDAIILQHFWFWHQNNDGKEHAMKDDHPYPWTYNTISKIAEIFPYMTEREVRLSIQRLEEHGYIIVSSFNKFKFDKTKWYALTEKSVSVYTSGELHNVKSELQNVKPVLQNVKPTLQNVNTIPYSKTDTKRNNKNNDKKLKAFKAGTLLDDSFGKPENLTSDQLKALAVDI